MKLGFLSSSIFLACLLLSGCGEDHKTIEITSRPGEFKVFQPVDPKPVSLNNITLRVINSGNIDTFVKEQKAKAGTENIAFIAISISDYENLILNIEELHRYIKDQKSIIVYYRKMTAPTIDPNQDKNITQK